MHRHDVYTNSALVERVEIADVAGVIEYRRFDGQLVLVEQRRATEDEAALLAATEQAKQSEQANARLRDANAALKGWSSDAAAVHSSWPNLTNDQKDGFQRETMRRLGILFDNMADLLQVLDKRS